jgi:peptidyl-prolyl cis-trans isomerase D
MMAQIRAFAKSPFATALLGLLMVAFIIFGIRGVATNVGAPDEVLKAGGRPAINAAAFKERFNFFKTQVEQQNQQPISVQDAVAHDLDRRVLDKLAFSESFADMEQRMGIRPADQLIVDKLRTIPKFFNPISGQFDKDAYNQFLAQNNMTAAQAEGELRDEIGERQFVSGMAAGLRSPLAYSAMQAAYLKEGRSFQWFVVGPQILGPPIKPTDAQLNAFIKENGARLMKPEMRQLSIVHFSAAALAPTITPSDADIQKRFNFEKDTLSSPEKRSFVQIPIKDPKTGADIAARLKAGADPALLAKQYGVQPVTYTDQPKGGVADKGVAAAAFALKAGETSGPINGDLGPSVVRLFSITPGHEATLADAKAKIEAEVRKASSEEKVYALVQKYDDMHSGGSDMAASAKAAGQTVTALPPIVAKGTDLQGQPSNLPPKVLQAAFSQAQGADTDPIDMGQGEYYVVRVDKVLPPALPLLDEIRPKLTQYFMLRDATAKLQAKAQALAAAIAKGQSMSEAAKSVGATVSEASNVLRNGTSPAYSADLVGRLFLAKPGEVVVGEDVKLGFAVGKLEKVVPADPAAIAPLVLQQRDQVSKSLFDDLGQATRQAARSLVKPHVDYAKARAALGIDPATLPASTAAPGLAK